MGEKNKFIIMQHFLSLHQMCARLPTLFSEQLSFCTLNIWKTSRYTAALN